MSIIREVKKCASCDEIKPINMFHKSASSADGHQYVCKSCTRIYGMLRSLRRKGERPRRWEPYGGTRYGCRGTDTQTDTHKLCTMCNKVKPISDFVWVKAQQRPTAGCKECRRTSERKRRAIQRAIQRAINENLSDDIQPPSPSASDYYSTGIVVNHHENTIISAIRSPSKHSTNVYLSRHDIDDYKEAYEWVKTIGTPVYHATPLAEDGTRCVWVHTSVIAAGQRDDDIPILTIATAYLSPAGIESFLLDYDIFERPNYSPDLPNIIEIYPK